VSGYRDLETVSEIERGGSGTEGSVDLGIVSILYLEPRLSTKRSRSSSFSRTRDARSFSHSFRASFRSRTSSRPALPAVSRKLKAAIKRLASEKPADTSSDTHSIKGSLTLAASRCHAQGRHQLEWAVSVDYSPSVAKEWSVERTLKSSPWSPPIFLLPAKTMWSKRRFSAFSRSSVGTRSRSIIPVLLR